MSVDAEKTKGKVKVKQPKNQYFVCSGRCVYFQAGVKTGGDEVDPRWPEFKNNSSRLKEMVELGLIQVVEV